MQVPPNGDQPGFLVPGRGGNGSADIVNMTHGTAPFWPDRMASCGAHLGLASAH
jgi:hypothetical protein